MSSLPKVVSYRQASSEFARHWTLHRRPLTYGPKTPLYYSQVFVKSDTSRHQSNGALHRVGAALNSPMPIAVPSPVSELKAALLDSLFGTERGLSASSELRAEINELISQIETQNPTPVPTEAMEKLTGSWKLVYTSSPALLSILAINRLPLVTVGDITQQVNAGELTVENKVQLSVPFSRTSFATQAQFEVRSPKRLSFRFTKGVVETPELLFDAMEGIPENITVLGQTLNLRQLKETFKPVTERLRGIVQNVGSFISQQPNLNIPFPEPTQGETWLLTTYLDDDTRIARGDGGSVFVLVKDVSLVPAKDTVDLADKVEQEETPPEEGLDKPEEKSSA